TGGRVVEPFFTTKAAGEGTGLGHSMVYGIIKQIHGHVAVESKPGDGTVFRIYLPQLDEPLIGAEAVEPAARGPRGSGTILLVEDEELVRNMTRRILEERGYRVIASDRADTAVEALQGCKDSIDLLLTDVVIPGGMNGRMLAQLIRAERPGARVLFMSGYTSDVVMRHGILTGDVAFLQKPFSP